MFIFYARIYSIKLHYNFYIFLYINSECAVATLELSIGVNMYNFFAQRYRQIRHAQWFLDGVVFYDSEAISFKILCQQNSKNQQKQIKLTKSKLVFVVKNTGDRNLSQLL